MRLVWIGVVALLLASSVDARPMAQQSQPKPEAPAPAPANGPNSPARIQQCAAARDATLLPANQRLVRSCGNGPVCDAARANMAAEQARANAEYDACVKRP